jgi:hypothetical protein
MDIEPILVDLPESGDLMPQPFEPKEGSFACQFLLKN